MQTKALLVTEDGSSFHGFSVGALGTVTGEIVFNTSVTGYQEILTDPSYSQQLITFTQPHIGNVGINLDDQEATTIHAHGAIMKSVSHRPSNWRSQQSLPEWLAANNKVAIAGVDTRRLTRLIREQGALRACIMAGEANEQVALANARAFPGLSGQDLAKAASCNKAYQFTDASWFHRTANAETPTNKSRIVVVDFGVKQSILRQLVDRGATVQVVPATTTLDELLAYQPDGVLLSNGPGDPEPCTYAIELIQGLCRQALPVLGICLGHQLLCLALGAKTMKMKFGHHGGNHPIMDIESERVFITSQNHGFAVDESTLPSELTVTHRSLFDGTLQGVAHKQKPIWGLQGHPEAGPGPLDLLPVFDRFIDSCSSKTASHLESGVEHA